MKLEPESNKSHHIESYIDTGGGTYVQGDIDIHDGDFVGRDKILNIFYDGIWKAQQSRIRRIMLNRVKSFWIDGVLSSSSLDESLLNIQVKETLAAGDHHSWQDIVPLSHPLEMEIPAGMKIIDIFDLMNESMLILGDAGSGKTTALLKLAQEAIMRAENDPAAPLPVIFHLSSWSTTQQPLADWLVEELKLRYYIPYRIGQPLIRNQELLLLLDGLDEVQPDRRNACVNAINKYISLYGPNNIVLCSRSREYQELASRLTLFGSVAIQPLTLSQIDNHFQRLGFEVSPLRIIFQKVDSLQKLVQTPLMLNIVIEAYKGKSMRELEIFLSSNNQLGDMLNVYIDRMFNRNVRAGQQEYSKVQTTGWLAWLAQKMLDHNESIFFVDYLQPSWLSNGLLRGLYAFFSRVLIWLIIGAILGLWKYGLIIGIVLGIISGLNWSRPVELFAIKKKFSLRRILWGIGGSAIAFLLGYLCGHVLGEWYVVPSAVQFLMGIIFGLFFVLCFLLLRRPYTRKKRELDIKIVEKLGWTWFGALKGAFVGFLVWLVISGVFVLSLQGFLRPPEPGTTAASRLIYHSTTIPLMIYLPAAVLAWLSYISLFSVVGGVFGGIQGKIDKNKSRGNRAIHWSAVNAIMSSIPFLIIIGFIAAVTNTVLSQITGDILLQQFIERWVFSSTPFDIFTDKQAIANSFSDNIVHELSKVSIGSVRLALVIAALAAMRYGFSDVIKHFILRSILRVGRHIPWNYAEFLDFCVDHVFLQKVGGGYIFIHRILLEHFAEMAHNKAVVSNSNGN